MQYFRIFPYLFFIFMGLACANSQKIIANGVQSCLISKEGYLHGQIQYFHGMNLLIKDCGILGNEEFDFKNEEELGKVFNELDIDGPTQGIQYVDIEFSGMFQKNGKFLILDVSKANSTEKSKYPPNDGELCRHLGLPVKTCMDLK